MNSQHVRKSNVAPVAKLEVYESLSDTEAAFIITEVESVSVLIDNSRFVKRTLTVSIDNKDRKYSRYNFKGKILKPYQGYIVDGIETYFLQGVFKVRKKTRSIKKNEGYKLSLEARDLSGDSLVDSEFKDAIDYSQTVITTDTSITDSTASSELTSGEKIQGQAIVSLEAKATVKGVEIGVINQNADTSIKNLKDGNSSTSYDFEHTDEGLTQLEVTVMLDLQISENVSAIAVTKDSNSTLENIQYSTDGVNWTNFSTTVDIRYVKFKLTNTAVSNNKITISINEVDITATSNYTKDKSYDENSITSWRPDYSDTERQITYQFTSSSINTAYIDFGLTEQDKYNAVKYKLEYSTDGNTWIELYEETEYVYGLVEIAFDAVTASYLRLTIIAELSGITAIRNVAIKNISATYTYSSIIKSILTNAGFTDLSEIKDTNMTPNEDFSIQIGEEKYKVIQDMEDAINWSFYIDVNGKPNFKPIYYPKTDADYIYKFKDLSSTDDDIEYDNIYSLEITEEDNIRNYIIAVNSSDETVYKTEIKDDSAGPTSIQTLGEKVKVVNGNASTQEETDKLAVKEFNNYIRDYQQIAIEAQGNPLLNENDVIGVLYLDEYINSNYQIYSMSHKFNKTTGYRTNLSIYEL